jgi:hypothetical protein
VIPEESKKAKHNVPGSLDGFISFHRESSLGITNLKKIGILFGSEDSTFPLQSLDVLGVPFHLIV